MPRKKQYQWDVETNGQEAPEQLSRSAKKRQSSALQDLGAELTKLPVNELDRLPLTPDLLEALRLYARISNREGKRRQLQFIGRLMREVDAGPLAEAIEARKNGQQADAAPSALGRTVAGKAALRCRGGRGGSSGGLPLARCRSRGTPGAGKTAGRSPQGR